MRTLSDNSCSHFVRVGAQKTRDFRGEVGVAADNSHANCRLGSSSCFAALAQTKGRPRLAPGGKNHVRTKCKKPERQGQLSDVSARGAGQLRLGQESRVECQELGIHLIINRKSSIINPTLNLQHSTLNPHKTWRVREKPGEFEKSPEICQAANLTAAIFHSSINHHQSPIPSACPTPPSPSSLPLAPPILYPVSHVHVRRHCDRRRQE
jgi:hypothetical protein